MRHELDDLRTRYRESLELRREELVRASESLARGDTGVAGIVKRVAHSLKGSGATYGFPEISKASADLEICPEGELNERLDHLVQVLSQALLSGMAVAQRVLVVSGDRSSAGDLSKALGAKGREIQWADSAAEAAGILADTEIALILLALELPDKDGRSFLEDVRQDPSISAVPVMIISGPANGRVKAECFSLGIDAYFEKPLDLPVVSAAVSAALTRASALSRQTRVDPLTGLMNRAGFAEAYARTVAFAARTGRPVSLAMLDLDRFKQVNDTFGHSAGDTVLRKFGDLLSRVLRKSDVVCRWGGEEFAILFPGASVANAVRVVEKVLTELRAEIFSFGAGMEFHITMSAGVAAVDSRDTLDRVVAEADRFLYIAKTVGRNQVVSEETSVPAAVRRIVLAEDDEMTAAMIRHRLGKEGFDVVHVTNGLDVIKQVDDRERLFPSLFILDIQMPGMDGFEVLKWLRNTPGFTHTPILMLTSRGSENDVVHGFELGADDYVVKPFSPAELVSRVRRHLSRDEISSR